MSVSVRSRLRTTRRRIESARAVAFRCLFGTRLGFVLFLATLCFVGAYWRVEIFITDSYTLANAFVALADGQLAVDSAVYGQNLETPGMGRHDGRLYGRNYGQLVVALPVLWLLQGVTAVADVGVVFVAGWSLLVVILGRKVGGVVDRESLGTTAGALTGLVVFVASALTATPISTEWLPLAALQISAMVATAFAAVLLYRLLHRMHGPLVGFVASAGLVVATPVGFWASIPKRHVYVVALLLGVCYALYRSRAEPADGDYLSPLGFRALAYALVGLTTWVHAGEAFAIFLALVAVDLPTARSNDGRSLALVGVAFSVSMVPFFLTNVLISGDPLRPPRMLSSFGDVTVSSGFGSGSGSASGSSGTGDSGVVSLLPAGLAAVLSEALSRVELLFEPFLSGVVTIVDQPEAVYRTFVRSGYIESIGGKDSYQAINLSLVEGAPVAGAVVAVAVQALARIPGVGQWRKAISLELLRSKFSSFRNSPARAADVFLALTGVLFVLMYIQRLPIHAQVTVRYLLPLYPVAVYAIARQHSLRRLFHDYPRALGWTYLAGVFVGAQLLLTVVLVGSLGRGEAFQVHALAGLAVAAVLSILATVGVFTDRHDRATAIVFGFATALGTDFLVLSGLIYFQYGQYVVPVVDALARLLGSGA